MARRLPKLILVAAIICGGIGAGVFALKRGLEHAQQSRATTYVFDVADQSLSEELALQYAREALAEHEGEHSLEALEDDRATPPDRFLVRNTIERNSGYIMFQARSSTVNRCVYVSVADGKLTCVVTLPK